MPRADCGASCVRVDPSNGIGRLAAAVRATYRTLLVLALLPGIPLLVGSRPAPAHAQRVFYRAILRCLGVRITLSGNPIRNVSGCWWSAHTCPGSTCWSSVH
jgi:hypothetical protein